MLGDAGYYNPQRAWFRHDVIIPGSSGFLIGANMSLMRREALRSVGGFPSISLGEDQEVDAALRKTVLTRGGESTADPELPPEDWFYIYRWGESDFHLSGNTDPAFWHEVGRREFAPGRYELCPRWRVDYLAEVEQALASRLVVAVL